MPTLDVKQDYFSGQFSAMASPCEILIGTQNNTLAQQVFNIAMQEVARIEQKFSRYRDDNIIHQINAGKTIRVDDETRRLLNFAENLYQLSEGKFDITSGILRRVWHFDGSDKIPKKEDIKALLPFIGWDKVNWNNTDITLPANMEIDFGGIGKEYAVDQVVKRIQQFLISQKVEISTLVNFGGDICVASSVKTIHRGTERKWQIGIASDDKNYPSELLELSRGGIATSGDAHRFLKKSGIRYGHILDPFTGWPVVDSPSSITVAAATCTDAGILSTLGLLQGAQAEKFLEQQDVHFWCQR